jgi:hypothetical protein
MLDRFQRRHVRRQGVACWGRYPAPPHRQAPSWCRRAQLHGLAVVIVIIVLHSQPVPRRPGAVHRLWVLCGPTRPDLRPSGQPAARFGLTSQSRSA